MLHVRSGSSGLYCETLSPKQKKRKKRELLCCTCHLRLQRQRQEDQEFKVILNNNEFKASLGYARSYLINNRLCLVV